MLQHIIEAVIKQCNMPDNQKLLENRVVRPGIAWMSERFSAVFAIVQALAIAILLQCSMLTILVVRSFRVRVV